MATKNHSHMPKGAVNEPPPIAFSVRGCSLRTDALLRCVWLGALWHVPVAWLAASEDSNSNLVSVQVSFRCAASMKLQFIEMPTSSSLIPNDPNCQDGISYFRLCAPKQNPRGRGGCSCRRTYHLSFTCEAQSPSSLSSSLRLHPSRFTIFLAQPPRLPKKNYLPFVIQPTNLPIEIPDALSRPILPPPCLERPFPPFASTTPRLDASSFT
ncbi:hypothetical protein FN846DRAFT_190115 [Sphaerosporella brunnea]|uniref:Uncharacterized protein n=1 Tax=Sphaerosporella brunnea TaxID=1250544 RepID=A0A5J5ENH3_9PEZI|nr:hypothetical protein FN846DRAFT_190115 [Sphaerosporella brunnea]